MAAENNVLDPAEAAQRAGFSLKTIYRAIHAGELRARKVRSRWRIAPSDLDTWLTGADAESALLGTGGAHAVGSLAALRDIEGEAA